MVEPVVDSSPEVQESEEPLQKKRKTLEQSEESDVEDSDEEENEEDAWASGNEDAMCWHSCKKNVLKVLEDTKNMSSDKAKAFFKDRIVINVKNCSYDEDEIRSLHVQAVLRTPAQSGGSAQSKGLTLKYEYHHRCRMHEVEHFAKLQYSVAGEAMKKVFETGLKNVPGRGSEQVEKRMFQLKKGAVTGMQKAVFGQEKGWSGHDLMLLCYAACGVDYPDAGLQSQANAISGKSEWLGHHTRKVCQALTKKDNGYESESFTSRMAKAKADARKYARECGSDDGDDYW